jgi:hypothetical protein
MKILLKLIEAFPVQELLQALSSTGEKPEGFVYQGSDTVTRLKQVPVITDGEQSKPSFVTYPLQGSPI